MDRILITGGSGFIGTNFIEYFVEKDNEVLNVDIQSPQKESHNIYWKNIDILNYKELYQTAEEFAPTYIIHLAARANLTGKSLDDYETNIEGVENIIKIGNSVDSVKRILFASTSLVCGRGQIPKSDNDYSPPNLYGKSKAIGEQMVREKSKNFEWVIVRPTSIWGPWFGPTYRRFFELIEKGVYVNISGKMGTKTYGYIGNIVYQIDVILNSNKANKNTYYLGDYEPTNIKEWSHEIASEFDASHIKTVPRFAIRILAILGDILQYVGIKFPMNTYRFKNMTADGIKPIDKTKELVPEVKYSRQEGNRITIAWMKKQN